MIESGVELGERAEVDRNEEVASLFRRHYAPMCRLAYVILGDAGAAEEVVMEALVKTFSGWRRIKDLDRSEAYLKRAVVNGCRSKIRRKSIESRAAVILRSQAQTSPFATDPDQRETRREMWAAIQMLPERQRAAVVLFYYEDLPEAEIADILQCSIGTVKSQLFKARAKLGRSLGLTDGGADV
ncbi:MAG TPA: SigE family RNA polymerase sigma factor [Actinomycetota bacterium]|nr:SigE family RNA polymerase sigma factor [Actinomycetota bacterium]